MKLLTWFRRREKEKNIFDRICDEAIKGDKPSLILISWQQYNDLHKIMCNQKRYMLTMNYKTKNGEEWVLVQMYGIPIAPISEGNNENNRFGRLLLEEPNICDLREVREDK